MGLDEFALREVFRGMDGCVFRWLGEVPICLQGFGVHIVEGGDVVVPLQQRGGGTDAFDCARVQLPDRVKDGVVVGVQGVLLEFRVAGDVDLSDAIGSDGVDVFHGVEAVVLRRDVDVIDIEKDAAVGEVPREGGTMLGSDDELVVNVPALRARLRRTSVRLW